MKSSRRFLLTATMLACLPALAEEPSVAKIQDLPVPVQNQLLELFNNEVPAASNETFNATDVIRDNAPRRRLVFTAKKGNLYLVFYVHGGIGKHSHLVGIRYSGKSASPAINVSFLKTYESLAEVQSALSNFEFSARGTEY